MATGGGAATCDGGVHGAAQPLATAASTGRRSVDGARRGHSLEQGRRQAVASFERTGAD
ncbi:hypothetical protein ACP70R_009264 [Stipagrostis hirtigluma subsp. patula]